MRDTRVYYILPIALIIGILMLWGFSTMQPKPPDRADSFSNEDKVMYGSYILFELLGDIFPDSYIEEVKLTANMQIYYYNEDGFSELDENDEEYLENKEDYSSYYANSNYLFINNSLREVNDIDVEMLLEFVENGNTVFMAARIFPDDLVEELSFEVRTSSPFEALELAESGDIDSISKKIGNIEFDRARNMDYFSDYNSTISEVLTYNKDNKPNLIKAPHGDGAFILSTTPNLFTNYHILKPEGKKLIEEAFSHLPAENNIWWDEFYKVRFQQRRKLEESPLQYVYSQKSLSWAFWLIIIGVIIYVLFEIKRTQRIIPIIKPLPNATLEFTETIGRLYYESKDHLNIAEKKIKVFLAYIRRRYYLQTHLFTDEFMKRLSAKSGVEKAEIIELCRTIDRVRRQTEISENELLELSAKIDAFYARSLR